MFGVNFIYLLLLFTPITELSSINPEKKCIPCYSFFVFDRKGLDRRAMFPVSELTHFRIWSN
jgi:hypothetical protein